MGGWVVYVGESILPLGSTYKGWVVFGMLGACSEGVEYGL